MFRTFYFSFLLHFRARMTVSLLISAFIYFLRLKPFRLRRVAHVATKNNFTSEYSFLTLIWHAFVGAFTIHNVFFEKNENASGCIHLISSVSFFRAGAAYKTYQFRKICVILRPFFMFMILRRSFTIRTSSSGFPFPFPSFQ
jgi:hypothetical protein